MRCFIFFQCTRSSKSGEFYVYSTSRLALTTFQVLSSAVRLMAAVLDRADLKEIDKEGTNLYRTFLYARHCGSKEYTSWLAFTATLRGDYYFNFMEE